MFNTPKTNAHKNKATFNEIIMETRSGIDTLFSLVKILALSKMLSPCLYCIYQMHDNNEVFFTQKGTANFLQIIKNLV